MPATENELWHLYILKCRDNSLYTGITKDVNRRVSEHNNGKGCKYTRGKLPVRLVYTEKQADHRAALKRELEIKGWKRNKKLELIAGVQSRLLPTIGRALASGCVCEDAHTSTGRRSIFK